MTDDQTVTHIERNDESLTLRSGYGTLAKHLRTEVDVVVRRVDPLHNRGLSAAAAHKRLQHQAVDHLAVELGVGLRNDHIGNVTPHRIARKITVGPVRRLAGL